jgi:hypothetical protein
MTIIEGRTGLKFKLIPDGRGTAVQLLTRGEGNTIGPFIFVNETIETIQDRFYRWIHQGEYIQDAFREWTPYQREFLMTGYTEKEWNELFGEN